MADMQAIADAIIGGKREEVVELVKQALDEGVGPAEILSKGLIAGMDVVGRKFKANEFYVPEVLIAARAMSNAKEQDTRPGAMEILQPYLEEAGIEPVGTQAVGHKCFALEILAAVGPAMSIDRRGHVHRARRVVAAKSFDD